MRFIEEAIREAGGVAGELRTWAEGESTRLMFIGEAPGPTEVKLGRPFCGDSGKLLDSMCIEAGLSSAYITNMCKIFPGRTKDKKIRAPSVEEVAQWRDYLDAEIEEFKPTHIVLFGIPACKLVFEGQWKLGSIIGTTKEVEGIQYIAAYHPASFLYNQGKVSNTKKMNQNRRILSELANQGEREEYKYVNTTPAVVEGTWFIDVETEGTPDPRTATITEWSALQAGSESALLNFDRARGFPYRPDTAVFHNAMYDYPLLLRHDPSWGNVVDIHDTMLLAYCQGYEDLSLKGLSNQLFGVKVYDYAQRDVCGPEYYNAQDVFLTRRLFDYLLPRQEGSCYDLDRQLIRELAHASLYGGYQIDKKKLEKAITEVEAERLEIQTEFTTKYEGINMASPAQLAHVFPTKDTKAETLKALGTMDAHLLLRWRELNTDLTRYLYPCRDADRLNGMFRLTTAAGDEKDTDEDGGTGTGRLSSKDRNLQNLDPILQACLHAPANMDLLRLDNGQVELRVAAEWSQDPVMIGALTDESRNLHQETADLLGVSYKQGKTANFAVLFMGGPGRFQQIFNCSKDEAEWMVGKLQGQFAGFYERVEEHWNRVLTTGISEGYAPFGHLRKIHIDKKSYDHAKKQAANHPIQSGAVYISKAQMVEVGYSDAHQFVNQIHDELHFFIPKGDKAQAKRIQEQMIGVGNQYLPTVGLSVDMKQGRWWEPK